MGDLVGKQGLELELEKQLRGRKGLYDVEVDAHARVLGKTLREEPRGGHEIHLSLDDGLQKAAWCPPTVTGERKHSARSSILPSATTECPCTIFFGAV